MTSAAPGPITRRRLGLAGAAGLAVVAVIVIAAVLWPDGEARPVEVAPPAPQTVLPGTLLERALCRRPATTPFVPTRISVPHVTSNAVVLALPRDAHNVPQAPPISSTGKTEFAWDAPTAKPGTPRGNVLINAHTWPDGTALGNHLLDNVRVGHTIIVRGKHGAELCYTVTKREVILASDGSWDYYEQKGPPQLALIVCSPPRLGPGNWLHRTIWYASPFDTAPAVASRERAHATS